MNRRLEGYMRTSGYCGVRDALQINNVLGQMLTMLREDFKKVWLSEIPRSPFLKSSLKKKSVLPALKWSPWVCYILFSGQKWSPYENSSDPAKIKKGVTEYAGGRPHVKNELR